MLKNHKYWLLLLILMSAVFGMVQGCGKSVSGTATTTFYGAGS